MTCGVTYSRTEETRTILDSLSIGKLAKCSRVGTNIKPEWSDGIRYLLRRTWAVGLVGGGPPCFRVTPVFGNGYCVWFNLDSGKFDRTCPKFLSVAEMKESS